MKTTSLMENCTSKIISEFAKRNYRTYVAHYKSRRLIPMSLNEFLKNYNN